MVGDDDDFAAVPDFRILAELALENADGARPADIVGHQNVRLHPEVVARLHLGLARRPRQNFLSQRHKWSYRLPASLTTATGEMELAARACFPAATNA